MTLQEINDFCYEEGKLENMLDLVNSGYLAIEVAVRKSGLTEAELNQALEEYRKSVSTQ